ncbi:hypothetical protein AMATHDRAFT_46293 [Amanita thiersii Skay4041]|uniref:Adenylyl cyclase-associated protein n=1 Tax=Amanita thiersii Skay4041 TaxID=703135 RepID=A0A2A9NPG1_9AGAR|nr:hypothetical protein AMATHDRAFT_46293 [Amanita thiersii Skay4041]
MSSGLYSLATIIKRLEAATTRLEDVADFFDKGRKNAIDNRPAQGYDESAPPQLPPPPEPLQIETPPSVIAYEENVINGCLQPFVELTKSFASNSVVEAATLLETQLQAIKDLLLLSANCTKPSQEELDKLIKPLYRGIEAIEKTKDGNKKERDWFTHLTFISAAAPVVGWVLHPKPAPYIMDIKESAEYYGNKLIKEWKEKDTKHVEWVRALTKILNETKKYVEEYNPTGLSWNPKVNPDSIGINLEEFQSKTAVSAAASAPPPPPPPPPPMAAQPSTAGTAGGVAAVFAELNRGEEVTKGLRKVDKSEMTHKNPALRAGNTVPAAAPSSPVKRPAKPSKPQALAGKKPSKFALEGNKWLVEYYENPGSPLVITEGEINNVVNIFGCKKTTVVIKGKVNAVTLGSSYKYIRVNCTTTSVLVDSVVSSISITRSPSFQLQVTGTAPMIQIDSTDSGQIYLSKASLNAEITTAKCSAINVSLPVEGEEDGVFEEQAIPEMLKSVVKDGKVVTSVVEHVG